MFARPRYQDGVGDIGAHRGVPDFAADASASSELALIAELPSGPLMTAAAGTSAGAWAGLVAWLTSTPGATWALSTLPFTASPKALTATSLFTTS